MEDKTKTESYCLDDDDEYYDEHIVVECVSKDTEEVYFSHSYNYSILGITHSWYLPYLCDVRGRDSHLQIVHIMKLPDGSKEREILYSTSVNTAMNKLIGMIDLCPTELKKPFMYLEPNSTHCATCQKNDVQHKALDRYIKGYACK